MHVAVFEISLDEEHLRKEVLITNCTNQNINFMQVCHNPWQPKVKIQCEIIKHSIWVSAELKGDIFILLFCLLAFATQNASKDFSLRPFFSMVDSWTANTCHASFGHFVYAKHNSSIVI